MKEKKPKSPIVVMAAMLFLAMFIVLPPLFRAYFPEEEEEVVETVNKEMLMCERISISEKYKITVNISYEDAVALKNTTTYIPYEPTAEEIAVGDTGTADKTVVEELTYFKGVSGVVVNEGASQTTVMITMDVVDNNPEMVELSNYMMDIDAAVSNYEAQGYTCTKVGL